MTINEIIGLACLLFWPLIPIFWFITHGLAVLGKRPPLLLPFLITAIFYLPLAIFLTDNVSFFLSKGLVFPLAQRVTGWLLFSLGILLHIWTLLLLGKRIIGIPEIQSDQSVGLVTKGPFKFLRHPTYLAHHMIFLGAWFITGFHAILVVFLLDVVITRFFIVPMEERELKRRFGKRYESYTKKTVGF